MGIGQGGFRAGQHSDPLTNAQRLIKGFADASEIDVALWIHTRAFRPEPGSCFCTQHIERGLADFALTAGVKQVVDGAQLGRGDPEAQHRGAPAVGPGLGFVVNNLRLRWHKLTEFGDLFLEESRLRGTSGQGQLGITPAGTAIWDEAAVSQQQAQESADVCGVQFFTLQSSTIVRLRRQFVCLLTRLTLFGAFNPMWIDNDFPKLLGAELYRPHPSYIVEMAVEPVVVHDFAKQPGQTVQLDR